MGIILKHIFKNIFGKFGRTLLIVVCIMICSLMALASFDLTSSMKSLMMSTFSQLMGTAEIMVTSEEEIDLDDEALPEIESCEIYDMISLTYVHSPKSYYMVEGSGTSILSFDIDKASRMGFGGGTSNFADGQCLINDLYQKKYGVQVGDTIQLYDKEKNCYEFEVVGMAVDLSAIVSNNETVVVTKADYKKLSCGKEMLITLIDVKDDSKAVETTKYLKDKYPEYDVVYYLADEELNSEMDQITQVLSLILLICILMVIFVTISLSERIICERMAVVGTLRSLGFSRNATTVFLLAENVMYGLLGSVIGVAIYSVIRVPIFSAMFGIDPDDTMMVMNIGHMDYLVVTVVIVVAILIEILCSLKEVLKAVKTPIRDIVFSNKDAKYELNKITVIIGIAAMLVAAVLFVVAKTSYMTQIAAIVLMMAGISMVAPCFIVVVGKTISNFFEKKGKIIPSLASRECYTKKNTVGAGILITTVVALCIVVISYSSTLMKEYQSGPIFSSDIMVQPMGLEMAGLRYIEHLPGVTDVKYSYNSYDKIGCGDMTSELYVYSLDPTEDNLKYDKSFEGLSKDIAEDEIYVSKSIARKMGFEEGKTYTITFNSESFMSFDRQMKVVGIYNESIKSMVMNADVYKNIYGIVSVSRIYVCCDNPEETDEFIGKHTDGLCYTFSESLESEMEDQAMLSSVITAILIIGCGITFIGASGSLLIGFEARKREIAVLLATSLTRKKLALSLFLESFFTALLGIIFAAPFGFILTIPVRNILEVIEDEYFVFHYDISKTICILVVMVFVFSLMSLQPIEAMRKMKLSEQLKYE